jgi:hypothetical protein
MTSAAAGVLIGTSAAFAWAQPGHVAPAAIPAFVLMQ